MTKKRTRAQKDRVRYYLWLLHEDGEEIAAMLFPDVHEHFRSAIDAEAGAQPPADGGAVNDLRGRKAGPS